VLLVHSSDEVERMAGEIDEGQEEGLLQFLWRHKIWWITPAVSVLVITALLLYFGRSTASSPFVYTLF